MTGKADVQALLTQHRLELSAMFTAWGSSELDPGARSDMVHGYFSGADLGTCERVGGGKSLLVSPKNPDQHRARVLVVGRHDTADLTDSRPASAPDASVVGPGIASRLGPTIAFAEGVLAARDVTAENPVNMSFLSLGEGDLVTDLGSAPALRAALGSGSFDAIYLTNAVNWSPHHPTLTVGARGRHVVELALTGSVGADDFVTSGALRNPLTKLVQLLGDLRDDRGRIALPGFYDRAHAPDPSMRSALVADDHDPNAWAEHLSSGRPLGALSSTERATLWPGVSVLSMNAEGADGSSTPTSATATVAFYLVPDQRHAEVEHAVRDWFLAGAPPNLGATIHVLSSTRPFRADPDGQAVAAQRRAAYRIHKRHPILVPGGGAPGAGELAFAFDTPIAFAGITAPTASYGTQAEGLSWSEFDAGVELAAETCLQLRRR